MKMQLCKRCKKRPAMVYITPMQGDKAGPPEGLCLPCANELGIKPVNDILKKTATEVAYEFSADLQTGYVRPRVAPM